MKVCLLLLCACVMAIEARMGEFGLKACRDRSKVCDRLTAGQCYDEESSFECCRTCKLFSRMLSKGPGCEYGDQDPATCKLVRARHCSSQHYQQLCCGTCSSFNAVIP